MTSSSPAGPTASRPSTARSSSSSTTRTARGRISTSREVSIARRLVRAAEGQYLVNRASVRRTDLVEILSDVGLGAAMHSIVGQGKVEQVLASKAGGPARVRGGSGRAREVQAAAASRRAEARAGRAAGRARSRRRGGGSQAPAATRAPGHGGRARGEARGRDCRHPSADRAARPRPLRRPPGGSRAASGRRRVREARRTGTPRGAARRSRPRRGGALRRGGSPGGGGRRSVSGSGWDRAPGAPCRVGDALCSSAFAAEAPAAARAAAAE